MGFKPRTTKPEAGNKYYIRKASGGYSNAIKGSPTDKDCDVLANCVGYAYGRFNEIGGYGECKYLAPVNAENFMQYKGACKTGMTPQVGACMVWRKGATLSSSDGAGHVAIVEQVISPTEVLTSESGYNSSKLFWTQNRKKGADENWGQSSSYTFLGFIYNPAVNGEEAQSLQPVVSTTEVKKVNVAVTTIKNGSKGESVKAMQALLNLRSNAKLDVDGICGAKSDAAIRAFQKARKLSVDGICGQNTWAALIEG